MIIVHLYGGLGNQMFQYAMARAIAYRSDHPLKLDIRTFEQDALRSYSLKYFNITEEFATADEIQKLAPTKHQISRRFYHKIVRTILPYHARPLIFERTYNFDPAILSVRCSTYLQGYWQSHFYFNDIEEIIRREFTLKCPADEATHYYLQMIKETQSVSLHVRRGDYVSNTTTNRTHGVLPAAYYESAVEVIKGQVTRPHFFVFSDDTAWVKANLQIDAPVTFIDCNGSERAYEDLRLMASCENHIIANSTFSWWGAWLSSDKCKLVVAPKQWFAKQTVDIVSRYPADWIVI